MRQIIVGMLLGIGFAGACVAGLFATRATAKVVAPSSSVSAPSRVPPGKLARDQGDVRRVSLERPPAANEAVEPRDRADVKAASTEGEETEGPTEEERRVFAEGVFESQPYDASFASEAAQKLQAAVSALVEPAVRVNSVSCRSSLCRVEIAAENSKAGETYLRTFLRSAKWSGPGMAVREAPDARGAYVIRVYLARSGTSLPEPPMEPSAAP
jgi:hypothetical protein